MELYNPKINIMNDSHNQPNTPAYKKKELLFKKYQNFKEKGKRSNPLPLREICII